MIRKLMLLGLTITFLSTATYVFAEDVFITQSGSKYHKEICRLLKNKDNVVKKDKEEAIKEAYGPCGRCFKEDITAANGGQDKAVKTKKQ